MKKKLATVALALALIGAQVPAFAAEQAATDGKAGAEETRKVPVVVQGENGPEVREMDVTVLRDKATAERKRYATVDFAQELGLDKRPPVLLRQMGLLVDQALEADDVAGLVGLSLSLAAFEKTAGKRASSLTGKDLLRLAGQLAVGTQDKAGMRLVADAYQDAAFGLADQDKAEEFSQLAENTRGDSFEHLEANGLGERFLRWGIQAMCSGAEIACVFVRNSTDTGLSFYANKKSLGSVSSYSDDFLMVEPCGETLRLVARDIGGSVIASRNRYMGCGEVVAWLFD